MEEMRILLGQLTQKMVQRFSPSPFLCPSPVGVGFALEVGGLWKALVSIGEYGRPGKKESGSISRLLE